jgi:hypothetical protein
MTGQTAALTSNSTLNSDTIESGLITVVAKGNDTFFNLPTSLARGFKLEVEDAITVS